MAATAKKGNKRRIDLLVAVIGLAMTMTAKKESDKKRSLLLSLSD